jgi:hypothetical protein
MVEFSELVNTRRLYCTPKCAKASDDYKYAQRHLKKLKNYQKSYRTKNKEKISSYHKDYYRAKKQQLKAYKKTWHQKNKDKNRARKASNLAKYRASKANRTPKWLTKYDFKKIEQFYKLADELSLTTGTKYSVDHIIPLQGDIISGLHVPENLQVIPLLENIAKSNKYET